MDFLLYITERCNLRCGYCDSPEEAVPDFKDITYGFEKLKKFLSGFDKVRIKFYGGGTLLNVPYADINLAKSGNLSSANHVPAVMFLIYAAADVFVPTLNHLIKQGLLSLGDFNEDIYSRFEVIS